MAHLRKEGYTPWIVEHWNPWTRRRQDLFGFADIIAIKEGEITLVQTTSGSNMSARRKKILANEHAHNWILAGGTITLHGWAKKGERNKRKTWQLKEEIIVP